MKIKMQTSTTVILTVLVAIMGMCILKFNSAGTKNVGAMSMIQKEYVMDLVTPSVVIGKIVEDTDALNIPESYGEKIFEFKEGTNVEILEDRLYEWYHVRSLDTEDSGWILKKSLCVPEDEQSDKSRMTEIELNSYATIMEFDSQTDAFVWVDINRQLVHIFKKSENEGSWQIDKTFICSTGRNTSPTIRGYFEIKERGTWFYSERLKSGAKNWIRFNDTYLFHSVAMDRNQNVIDDTLGERSSSGCVRLSEEDIKWFYDNVPDNTAVFIN